MNNIIEFYFFSDFDDFEKCTASKTFKYISETDLNKKFASFKKKHKNAKKYTIACVTEIKTIYFNYENI